MSKTSLTTYFDGYKMSSAQTKVIWICGLVYAFELLDMTIFSFVSPVLTGRFGLTVDDLATLNMILFFSMFLGSYIGGYLGDKIGRKKTIIIGTVMFSLASIANACWNPGYFALLEVSRFFTGMGCMIMNTIAMTYISEMVPAEKRGKMLSFAVAGGTISIPVVSIIGSQVVANYADGWRYLLIFGGLGIVFALLGSKWMLESPRWLVTKGRVQEAEAIMEKCLGFEVDLSEAYNQHLIAMGSVEKISTKEALRVMFSPTCRKQTIVACTVLWTMLIAINYLTAYFTTFAVNLGHPMAMVLLVSGLAAFGQPIGDFISGFISDKGGRTIPIMVCACGAGVAFLLMAVFQNTLVLLGVAFFLRAVIGAGAQVMTWSYVAESFPTRIRGTASGLAFAGGRLIIVFTAMTIPPLYEAFGFTGCVVVNAECILLPV